MNIFTWVIYVSEDVLLLFKGANRKEKSDPIAGIHPQRNSLELAPKVSPSISWSAHTNFVVSENGFFLKKGGLLFTFKAVRTVCDSKVIAVGMLFQQSVPGVFNQPHNNTIYNQKNAYRSDMRPPDNTAQDRELINSVSDLNVANDETWKERKDPFSTKGPTSTTLVDFEAIAPPPPSKRFINDSTASQYNTVSSHQYMDVARSSASRFGQTVHENPHALPSMSYGSMQIHPSYQHGMATSASTLPMSNHHTFQQHQPTYSVLQQQQHLQAYHPSIMVPPQSPTLASYYFEGSNSWFDQYQDPKRLRNPSAHVDTDYLQMMQHRQQWYSMNAAAANLMVGYGFADAQAMQQWLLQQQQTYQVNSQASINAMYQLPGSNSMLLNGQQYRTIQQQQQALLMQQQLYTQQHLISSMAVPSSVPPIEAQYLDNVQRRKHSLQHMGALPRTTQPYSASIPHPSQCKLQR